jgi:hypothetical protein
MNYLLAWLLVGLVTMLFLGILALSEHGGWTQRNTWSIVAALRELVLGRRAS